MKKKTTISRATRTHKATRKFSPTASKAGRRAKPKTAYELLQRACEAIKATPQAYFQNWWRQEQACGTAFCRAGWIVALHDGKAAVRSSDETGHRALDILGHPQGAWDALFVCGLVDGTPGTTSYASQGIRGLRDFMKTHRAHLKARLLKDVPHVS